MPFGGSFFIIPVQFRKVSWLLTLLTPACFWKGSESFSKNAQVV